MVARSVLIAGAGSLLAASVAFASPALTGAALAGPSAQSCQGAPPAATRIAATTATFNAIEAKIAAGTSLRLRFPDPTAQEDIIDYGLNDLWQKGIDGACVTVAPATGSSRAGPRTAPASWTASACSRRCPGSSA